MAAANLIARIEAKLDAQNAKFDSQRWVTGGGFAQLGVLITAFRLLA